MADEPELVGREAELALVRSVLVGARPAVVIGGHAGVGKTSVARAVAAAWSGGSVWISGVSGAAGMPGAALLGLVDEIDPATTPGLTADLALVHAAMQGVRAQPERLLVVDDIHALDDLSALLVQQVVLAGCAPILLTVRTGEPVTDVLAHLWRDGLVERLDVSPLSEVHTDVLAERLLGGPVEAATAGALFAASLGNPLLLSEVVRDAIDAGTVHPSPDGWAWTGSTGRARRLRETMERRLAALGPAARRMVTLLAVGAPLGVSTLLGLVGDVDLEDGERRGLIRIEEDGRRVEARLAHPLFGEIITAQATANAEVTAARVDLADAVDAHGARRRADLLLVAKLRLDAGDRRDPGRLAQAAARSLELGDARAGREFAEAALAIDPGRHDARILVAEAALLEQDAAGGLALLAAAPLEELTDRQRMQVAQGLQQAHRLLGRGSEVPPLLGRIAELMEDRAWRGVVECLVAQQCMFDGDTTAAFAAAEHLLAHDDPRVRMRLVPIIGVGSALRGDTTRALQFVGEMLPVALSLQQELPLAPAWVMNAQGVALLVAGRLGDALGFIGLVRSLAAAQHVSQLRPTDMMLDVFDGRIELARGHVSTALAHLEPACDGLGRDHISGIAPWAHSLRAEALALSNRIDEARAAAALAVDCPSTMHLYDGDAARARAWVTAMGGQVAQAIAELSEIAARQHDDGQLALELLTLHDALRLGSDRTVAERLRVAAAGVDGALPGLFVEHADALDAGAAALEASAAGFEAAEMDLVAAETFAAAAARYTEERLTARANAATRRCEAAVARCGGVRTPSLLGGMATTELTMRERDVVLLAAQGLSNREIAERLFVSVRTAEGHLYRASVKLGVQDRSELRAMFGPNA